MKRRYSTYILLLLAVLLSALPLKAQNNIYKIDDSCFPLYMKADSLISTNKAMPKIDELMAQAVKVGDQKAQTLALVLKLRNANALKNEKDLLEYFAQVQAMAQKSGYLQYYFYAYQIIAVFYYNNDFTLKAIDIAIEMHDKAVEMQNDYGIWQSSVFLAELYWSSYKRSRARHCFLECIDTFNNTDDPTIKSQSLTKIYYQLAFTYNWGSEDQLKCIDKAEEHVKRNIDQMQVDFIRALNAAIGKDEASYRRYRNNLINSPLLSRAHGEGKNILEMTDRLIGGDWNLDINQLPISNRLENLTYLAALAMSYGKSELVIAVYDKITSEQARRYEGQMSIALTESNVMLENYKLSQNILEQKTRINKILSFLIFIIIAAVICFAILISYYVNKLRKAKEEAEEANRMKTHFVQNMSHEIRTPLNSVVGYAQLLAVPGLVESDEEKKEYGSYIKNNAAMLTMLIDDILDLSDIDNGNYHLQLESCSCNTICRQSMVTVEGRVPAGVKLSFESSVPDDLTVFTDCRRVQQIIINFLTNSCKYTAKGTIVLSCSTGEKEGCVSFAVSDTGKGVPPEKADKIFQRFTKLDNFKQGSGLGLNICNVFAEKLGGTVELDENYGRCLGEEFSGARFVFHLPLSGTVSQQ